MADIVEEHSNDEWLVETDSGWQDFSSVGKTIEYQVYEVHFKSGKVIRCADDHIFITDTYEQIFCKDLIHGTRLKGKCQTEIVKNIIITDEYENMYDLIDVENGHTFYTDDILSHNSTTVAAFVLHYIIFNEAKTFGILAHKESTAKEILKRVKDGYESLPLWLQQGAMKWNETFIELENGSRVIASATSGSAVRGYTFSGILMDEAAFVPTNIWNDFFKSVYPTISSGKKTKLFMISTANGMNHFHSYWENAVKGKSKFVPFTIDWWDVPGRDEEWKQEQIANTSLEEFEQEFVCKFIGNSNSLIDATTMKWISPIDPIEFNDVGVKIYENPVSEPIIDEETETVIPPAQYCILFDSAQGFGGDYSAASVIRIDERPYKQVATFYNNKLSTQFTPDVLVSLAKTYNNASILIEMNEAGGGDNVANIIWNDHEYEYLMRVGKDERGRQILGNGKNLQYGIKTTKSTKRIGLSTLKTLLENKKLIINDKNTHEELKTFIRKKDSYEADKGYHDDLITTLSLFAWMTTQQYFDEMTEVHNREVLFNEQMQAVEEELSYIGLLGNYNHDESDEWVQIEHQGSIQLPII